MYRDSQWGFMGRPHLPLSADYTNGEHDRQVEVKVTELGWGCITKFNDSHIFFFGVQTKMSWRSLLISQYSR